MNTQKSGWEKIAEQENKGQKNANLKKNADTAATTTSYVAWIVFIIVVAIVLIVLFGTRGLNFLF